ncbi:quinoprotein glucose dehydrogenase [Haloterrigena salina JCM 13891]|uniref:Quinoprotein glucose dehydrogenase n=2 Tax=Haloterrigena salina TaxID=504937 RepID=M0CP23_9EURY|nr:quinoprotein glucose dehydrogenase [Haloterrigena salina JCM 13891]
MVGSAGCFEGNDSMNSLIPSGPSVALDTIAQGLTYPTDFVAADDGKYFVTDQVGTVHVIQDGSTRNDPFLDISDRIVDLGFDSLGGYDERGLLGMELHPSFGDNGRFYLRYSTPPESDQFAHIEILSEFQTTADGRHGDPTSERVILAIPQPASIHNSGNVVFGPDDYLYVSTGDGGKPYTDQPDDWYENAPGGTAQITTDNLFGGVLRIDVDAETDPYGIPADNPFLEDGMRDAGRPEYYAWGFRNPWGMSFDGDELYVADVGESNYESVNRVEKGGNYGWNVKEGTHCFDSESSDDENCPDETPASVRNGEPLLDPVIEYPHWHDDVQLGSGIIGGYVYRGDAMSDLDGAYLFGDWSADPHGDPLGSVFIARPSEDVQRTHQYNQQRSLRQLHELEIETGDGSGELSRYVSAFGQDLNGEVYVLTTKTSAIEGTTGEIHRLVPPAE